MKTEIYKQKQVDIHTFHHLFTYAITHRLLQEKQVEAIKKEIYDIAKELVLRYNSNRSTSISKRRFLHIMDSIYYVLDHGLEKMLHPMDALLAADIKDLYDHGMRELNLLYQELEEKHIILKKSRYHHVNERYYDVIDNQILQFLTGYDMEFLATRCKYDLDYPLIDGIPLDFDMYRLKGLDLVLEYATRLLYEERFCAIFDPVEVELYLHDFEQQKGVSLHFLGINLCELLLLQLFFCLLLPSWSGGLQLIRAEAQHIAIQMFSIKIELFVKSAYQKLHSFIDKDVYLYLKKHEEQFIRKIDLAKQNESLLETIIYIQEKEEVFQLNQLMEGKGDQEFASLLEQIQQKSEKDKITFIFSCEFSLLDYIDLLDADILNESEYLELFQTFQVSELGMLLKSVCEEEFMFHQEVSLDKAFFQSLTIDQEWKHIFFAYLYECSSHMKQELIAFVRKMV